MAKRGVHILLPKDLVTEIDALVGARGRSAFVVEAACREIQRRRLFQFLQSKKPAWKDEDHPELAGGSAAWVSRLRHKKEEADCYGKESKARKRPY